MAKVTIEKNLDDPLMTIGADTTMTFDDLANSQTKRGSSEVLGSASEDEDEDEEDDELDNVDESEDLDPMEKDEPVSRADDEDDDDDDDDGDVEDEVGVPMKVA